jgi:branched-chain amino acid transport system substrate-binding protein
VEETNASGTLRVSLASRDDEGRPDRAVAAAEELIARARAAALVGGYVDTLVGPISEVAERQRIPFVATASLDERLTQRGYRYFFRISHLQAYVDSTVGVVRDLFRPRRVAILFSATPGASQLAQRQRERLEQAAIQVPVFEMFTSGMSDFTPLLARVRDAAAEVLIADAFFGDHLVMVRQLRALEVNVKAFLGAFGMEFPEVITDLGPSGEFLFGTTGWEPGIVGPAPRPHPAPSWNSTASASSANPAPGHARLCRRSRDSCRRGAAAGRMRESGPRTSAGGCRNWICQRRWGACNSTAGGRRCTIGA